MTSFYPYCDNVSVAHEKIIQLRNSVPHHLLASIQVVVRPLPAERAIRVSIIRFPVIVRGAVLLDEGPRPALDEGVAEARRVEVEARVGGLADLLEVLEGVRVRTLVVRFRTVQPLWKGLGRFILCLMSGRGLVLQLANTSKCT